MTFNFLIKMIYWLFSFSYCFYWLLSCVFRIYTFISCFLHVLFNLLYIFNYLHFYVPKNILVEFMVVTTKISPECLVWGYCANMHYIFSINFIFTIHIKIRWNPVSIRWSKYTFKHRKFDSSFEIILPIFY